jgi:hypothetical protein
MQVMLRNLLTAVLVASLASCSLNDHGLGATDAARVTMGGAGHPQGTAGGAGMIAGDEAGAAGTMPLPTGTAGTDATSSAGATGSAGAAGAGGDPARSGAAGDASASGVAGNSSVGGGAGTSSTAGAAGTTIPTAGTGGAGGKADAGTASGGGGTAGTGSGAAGAGSGGGAGAAGATAHPELGCSDGTREGYLDESKYPNIAACAGAWAEPGLASMASRTPQCDRRAGNDGDKSDGRGCSVADLCASGWHVCETGKAVLVAAGPTGCADALAPFANNQPVFFVSRQRAVGLDCDNTTQTGANNVYGCGNIGSAADKASCAPFTHMLRDSDCQVQAPWVCADGPVSTASTEYNVVTKESSSHGGALCCKD